MKTLVERYNAEAARLMPHMAEDLKIDPMIDSAGDIDDIVFRRSEYLGGMAAILLALVEATD